MQDIQKVTVASTRAVRDGIAQFRHDGGIYLGKWLKVPPTAELMTKNRCISKDLSRGGTTPADAGEVVCLKVALRSTSTIATS